MTEIKNIAVFCGSSDGNKPVFTESAYNLGVCLAKRSIGLIYGGGARGLMGACARGCAENGGKVIGVIPQFLNDIASVKSGKYETELIVTKDMHERKSVMCENADAFIALPGGIGTYEEIFEQIAWLQLRLHNKVCGFLNTDGFYNSLIDFLSHSVKCGFTRESVYKTLCFEADALTLLEEMCRKEITLPPKIS